MSIEGEDFSQPGKPQENLPLSPEAALQATKDQDHLGEQQQEARAADVQQLEEARAGLAEVSTATSSRATEQMRVLDLARQHPVYSAFLSQIPEAILTNVDPELLAPVLEKVATSFAEDPKLAETYIAIFVEGNRELLKQKSEQQLQTLTNDYYGSLASRLRRPKEFLQKRARLQQFQQLARSLTPVRNDPNVHEQYESPRRSGKIASFGAVDTVVQADNYVYASIAEFPHDMTKGTATHKAVFSREGIADRSEIVMQDAADMHADSLDFCRRYLTNTFDFTTGTEILAVYMATVFESPEEAVDMLRRHSNRDTAQNWNRSAENMYIRGSTEPNADELARLQGDTGLWPEISVQIQERSQRRGEAVFRNMRRIFEETGIEPPLQVEVRIRDYAVPEKEIAGQ